jgi:hypothetical protein
VARAIASRGPNGRLAEAQPASAKLSSLDDIFAQFQSGHLLSELDPQADVRGRLGRSSTRWGG